MESTLKKICENTGRLSGNDVKKILIVYEGKIEFLGDCCLRFAKFKSIKSFFNQAFLHVNFSNNENRKFYNSLLKNNPFVDSISDYCDWEAFNLTDYDIIFCVLPDENKLLSHLHSKYGAAIKADVFNTLIYSLSGLLLKNDGKARFLFPELNELKACLMEPQPAELYISEDERDRADQWLKEQGLKKKEQLFIIIDTSSTREKLLNATVYMQLLNELLEKEDVKLLLFDERNAGKEKFYKAWLGNEKAKKLIFSKGLALREDIGLIASRRTKMIFGPCTGLMHCASGVYNVLTQTGSAPAEAPTMIVYTGEYAKENFNAEFWWGASPLITCLLLKQIDGSKQIVLLNSEDAKQTSNPLPCKEYTADMLIGVINSELHAEKFKIY